MKKNELVVFEDFNIIGTLAKRVSSKSEEGFSEIYYYPLAGGLLSALRLKKTKFPYAIPDNAIFESNQPENYDGVIPNVIRIYMGGDSSSLKKVMGDLMSTNNELRDRIKSLQKQVSASKQEASDARSGIGKTLRNMEELNRAKRRSPDLEAPVPPRGYRSGIAEFEDLEEDY